jgi:hypothetical protein
MLRTRSSCGKILSGVSSDLPDIICDDAAWTLLSDIRTDSRTVVNDGRRRDLSGRGVSEESEAAEGSDLIVGSSSFGAAGVGGGASVPVIGGGVVGRLESLCGLGARDDRREEKAERAIETALLTEDTFGAVVFGAARLPKFVGVGDWGPNILRFPVGVDAREVEVELGGASVSTMERDVRERGVPDVHSIRRTSGREDPGVGVLCRLA